MDEIYNNAVVQRAMLKKLAIIFSDIKLAHTIFALPFALASAHLAFNGDYELKPLLLILLCMFTARNAAMAFNRWIDRDIDTVNPRTIDRSIPSGQVKSKEMLIFVIVNSVIFITAAWFLNFLAFLLSPVALKIILGYSYLKRYTVWSHLALGLCLAIAPAGAWIAIRGDLELIPILLSIMVIFWVSGFDIIYACQDVDFDRETGLYSIPQRFGITKALIISTAFHVITIGIIVLVGHLIDAGMLYYIINTVLALILLVEHMLVTPYNLKFIGVAFFTLNGAVSILFYVAVLLKDLTIGF